MSEELFIPPPGTMQFHVRRNANGGPSAYSCVWVHPPQPGEETPLAAGSERPEGCQCTEFYPVVLASLPKWAQILVGEFQPVICECRGEVVE